MGIHFGRFLYRRLRNEYGKWLAAPKTDGVMWRSNRHSGRWRCISPPNALFAASSPVQGSVASSITGAGMKDRVVGWGVAACEPRRCRRCNHKCEFIRLEPSSLFFLSYKFLADFLFANNLHSWKFGHEKNANKKFVKKTLLRFVLEFVPSNNYSLWQVNWFGLIK